MKFYLIIVFSIFCSKDVCLSQVVSGKIFYRFEMKNKSHDHNDDIAKRMTQAVNNISKQITLELWFNKNLAYFFKKKSLQIREDEGYLKILNFAESLMAKGKYYTNLEVKEQILQKSVQDQDFYIRNKNLNQKWTLVNEHKLIDKYKCYKAILEKEIAGKRREIIAWYSPEIPLKLGPKEYVGNLPGLILELEEPIGTYKCSYIELNTKKEIKIKWPKKNVDILTQEEYEKAGTQFYNNITKN